MRIYKMTATFGKLQNETLTLNSGLNILHRPNEWGKSTWSAFLVAMLYGIDTSEREKNGILPIKTKYAPWSGVPMSGTMDICWEGRNITLQRTSTAKIPMGVFKAYETDTGLPVPELTAANCGEKLLGVDKNVFLRTGFIRHQDLPIGDDAALRNRLNALVTTGDESGDHALLVEKLAKLKNACKHNKTGLLPQAERERDALSAKLREIENLCANQEVLSAKRRQLRSEIAALKNHLTHLTYEKGLEEQRHLRNAEAETAALRSAVEKLEKEVSALPSEEEINYRRDTLLGLQQKWADLKSKPTPIAPTAPEGSGIFAGLSAEDAVKLAREHWERWQTLQKPISPLYLIIAAVLVVVGIAMAFVNPIWLATFLCVALPFVALHTRKTRDTAQQKEALRRRYGDLPPENWLSAAESYRKAQAAYNKELEAYHADTLAYKQEEAILSTQLSQHTLGKSVSEAQSLWDSQKQLWEELRQKKDALLSAQRTEETLRKVIKIVSAPETEDTLSYSEAQTQALLRQAEDALNRTEAQYSEQAGQLRLLGEKEGYLRQAETLDRRISALQQHCDALTLALETAQTASENLQRRFAPAISKEATRIFSSLTDGRYEKLVLSSDFTAEASARDETTLHDSRFRSDGTIDQLYLALRLAVAKTLCPHAPLVLDDALVRFDDSRLRAALSLLSAESEDKQVILFTCQSREQLTADNALALPLGELSRDQRD